MKVKIRYENADELRDVIHDLKDYSDIKINQLNIRTISVEYPDDWGVENINNLFRIENLTYLYYDNYHLTVIHDADVRKIKNMLSCGKIPYTINKKSIIIDATNLILDYFEFVEIIKKYTLNFLLKPYKDKNYIKLSTDVSQFYKTLTTQQKIYELGLFSDVEIQVENHIFKAHKVILAANSMHFFRTFNAYNPETDIIEIDADIDVGKDLMDLFYGSKIRIDGLKTLRLIIVILYLDMPEINIESIIKEIKIVPEFESNEYIYLISKIYPDYVPSELIPYLRQNITSRTDITNLPFIAQQELKNQ